MNKMKTYIVLAIYIIGFLQVASTANECSTANRQSNLNACLQAIRDTLQDKTKYYFGTGYDSRCPPQLQSTVECSIFVTPGSSVIDILYGTNGNFQPNLITKYLGVKFTSEPGSYFGCEHTFQQNDRKQFELDPLSMTANKAWDLRTLPEVTWEVESPSNKLYTLIVLDVGPGVTHAVYTNIQNNDITTATADLPYRGPKNGRAVDNVYVFFLLEQSRRVTVGPVAKRHFNISTFAHDNDMTGPIGVNIMLGSQDPYAAEYMRSILKIADTCADFVGPVLAKQGFPFIPQNPKMSMFVHMELTTEDLTFELCCKSIHYPGGTYVTDIFGTTQTTTASTRTGAKGKLILYPKKMNPSFNASVDFAGKIFTIMMVDPDVPRPTSGTPDRPILHGLTVNVQPHHLEDGLNLAEVIQSYSGPGPPDKKWHRYLTLVYEQKGRVNVTSAAPWIGSATCNRCLFNISKYVSDNNLQLLGATWFSAMNDPYIVKSYIDRNRTTEAEACKDEPGYRNPCPTSGGPTVRLARATFALHVILLYYGMFSVSLFNIGIYIA